MTDFAKVIVNHYERHAKFRGGITAAIEAASEDLERALATENPLIRAMYLRHTKISIDKARELIEGSNT